MQSQASKLSFRWLSAVFLQPRSPAACCTTVIPGHRVSCTPSNQNQGCSTANTGAAVVQEHCMLRSLLQYLCCAVCPNNWVRQGKHHQKMCRSWSR